MAKLIQLNLKRPEPEPCGVCGNLATSPKTFSNSEIVVGECPKCRRKAIVAAKKGHVRCRSCRYYATGGRYALAIDYEYGYD
jgi:hypothetical protein